MLEKLAGNDNVEKLRIIMLFKADFNHNNKWLGRATMQIAEKNKLMFIWQQEIQSHGNPMPE